MTMVAKTLRRVIEMHSDIGGYSVEVTLDCSHRVRVRYGNGIRIGSRRSCINCVSLINTKIAMANHQKEIAASPWDTLSDTQIAVLSDIQTRYARDLEALAEKSGIGLLFGAHKCPAITNLEDTARMIALDVETIKERLMYIRNCEAEIEWLKPKSA